MSLEGVNWLAVIVAGILCMVWGAVWYSPLLFGNMWLGLIGKTADQIESSPGTYAVAFVSALIEALVLAMVIEAGGATTLVSGLLTGALVWLGFVATSSLIFSVFEGPPRRVWLLYAGYQLAAFLTMGALIGAWQ